MNRGRGFHIIYFILTFAFTLCPGVQDSFGQKSKRNKNKNGVDNGVQAEYYFTEAEKYFILEDYPKALVLFQKASELSPNNAAINFKMAEVLARGGEYEQALYYANVAIDNSPQNKYYYLLAAEIYGKQANFEEAARVYERMIASIPNTDQYLFDLAAYYAFQEKYPEALEIYERIETKFGMLDEIIFEKQKVYLKTNQLDKAIAEGKRLIDAYPKEPRYLLKQAEILLSNEKRKEAVVYLEKAIQLDESSAKAQLTLAKIYRELGETEKSNQALVNAFSKPELDLNAKLQMLAGLIANLPDKKIEGLCKELAQNIEDAHPENANAKAIHGDLYYAISDREKAREKYLATLNIDENIFQVWQNIMSIEMDLNNMDQVIEYSDRAMVLFPNQTAVYYYGGTANLIQKDFDKAIKILEQGRRIAGSNQELASVFNSQLGDAYNGVKEYRKSEEAYQSALDYNPDNYYVLNNYSYFLSLRKAKLDLAEKMSAKLVKDNPDNPTYLDTHAWVLYMRQDYKEAKIFLEKAVNTGKASSTIIEHYGDVLFKLGEAEEAIKQWKIAKGMDSTSDLIDKKIADRKLYE